jgi:hypothetical protein
MAEQEAEREREREKERERYQGQDSVPQDLLPLAYFL